jgi:hypothetical protein
MADRSKATKFWYIAQDRWNSVDEAADLCWMRAEHEVETSEAFDLLHRVIDILETQKASLAEAMQGHKHTCRKRDLKGL